MTTAKNEDGVVSRARFNRERTAREEAERLLEEKSRELWDANQRLAAEARQLDAAVAKRTEELAQALSRAEMATRAKAQFVAKMSHEIRTPLNGVLGMAQSLLMEDLAPSQREKASIIVESGRSLTALLNDVLDLSKIEAGKLEVSFLPGDLRHLVRRSAQLFEARAEEKGLALRVLFADDIPGRLTFDPVRVRQCLDNMISNAIKFTPSGSVEVRVRIDPETALARRAHIEVADTGIGISEATQARLFQAFTQADGETTRRFGGTGLGLAISLQLSHLMGGDLVVRSAEGAGSTFQLSFVVGEAEEATTSPVLAASRGAPADEQRLPCGLRVLLVDDNAINRQVIKLFLALQGLEIVEASNGEEALNRLGQQAFDLVLLDIHMPVMDGREAIRRIRAGPEAWRDTPVIALTADAMVGDREKFIAMGMNDYISKPVDQRELISKISRYVDHASDALAQAS